MTPMVWGQLRKCYRERGIVAGGHHFTDYWGRDGFFAALGAIAIGDLSIAEKMVDLFFEYQREDGLIPYRIMNGPVSIGKYWGKQKFYNKPRPTYRLRGIGPEVLDGTTMSLWVWAELKARGWKKAGDYENKIKMALDYLNRREKNGLLWDGIMSEWNDTAYKFGWLLYSNVIYYQCLTATGNKIKAERVKQKIREKLWNGKYLADWFDYKRQDYLNTFANLMAIACGITTVEESATIMSGVEKMRIKFTFETNSPKYPWWRIDGLNWVTGLADYQNQGCLWWQPAIAYVAATKKMKRSDKCSKQLRLIVEKMKKDGRVWECFERSGKPVQRLLYTAEHPFAWAAGMFLWAYNLK